MKEKEKDLFNYKEDNLHVSEGAAGDKKSPMAGTDTTGKISTEQMQKEANQPGGAENAAGKDNPEKSGSSTIGSMPVSDDELDTGAKA